MTAILFASAMDEWRRFASAATPSRPTGWRA